MTISPSTHSPTKGVLVVKLYIRNVATEPELVQEEKHLPCKCEDQRTLYTQNPYKRHKITAGGRDRQSPERAG